MNTAAPTRPAHSPAPPASLVENWLEGWWATFRGLSDCLSVALEHGPTVLNVPHWLELTGNRRPPAWSTPHELVFETPIARLRDFSPAGGRGLVPTLVVPPQAGHDSCIVDYSAEQSQMRAIVDSGLTRAFSLDWIGASRETANTSVDDYLDVVDSAIDHVGGRANLIGDCQGGWLAAIYAALEPERVNTLTLAGAPIDFHAGEPVIHEVLRRVAPDGNLRFYEALVAGGGGVLKGSHMLAGFIAIQPGDEISRHLELLAHLNDPAHVARYREFEDWFKYTRDIPGAFYLWTVQHLFRDNELVRGLLDVGGRRVDLGRVDMPLNLLGGATDHITPPDQVLAISHHASTPPEEVLRDVTPGGHLGLFMGHQALREHWPALLANVLRHSKAAPRGATGEARRGTTPRNSKARRPLN